jgi:hypothetical protein
VEIDGGHNERDYFETPEYREALSWLLSAPGQSPQSEK